MSTTLKALEKIEVDHDHHRSRMPNPNSTAVLAGSSVGQLKFTRWAVWGWFRHWFWYALILVGIGVGLRPIYCVGPEIIGFRDRDGNPDICNGGKWFSCR